MQIFTWEEGEGGIFIRGVQQDHVMFVIAYVYIFQPLI